MPTYDCIIAQGCAVEPEKCVPAPTKLGDELCEATVGACGNQWCNREFVASLNAKGGYRRDDVIAAGRRCASQPVCADATECLRAWVAAGRF